MVNLNKVREIIPVQIGIIYVSCGKNPAVIIPEWGNKFFHRKKFQFQQDIIPVNAKHCSIIMFVL